MIDNTYLESVEESGDYLRMTLKNISKHKLPYNPNSYLLWYEYATGRNEHLIKDVEISIKKKKPITNAIVTELIKNHLVGNQAALAEKKAGEFQKILIEMTKHLNNSSGKINSQSNELETCAIELSQATSLDTITGISKRIVVETKSMIESSKTLKNQLDSTVSEINILRKELEGIKQDAKTDMLTRLLNRRGFDEAIAHTLENLKTPHESVSFIMMDIDYFKKVNDTYGHLVGDNVLKVLGKLIKDCIKGKDIAARFGGEEFILALPATTIEGAYALAEQIRLSLNKMNLKIKNTGKSIGQITISLGIALYKDDESIEAVIKRADDALYHAKNTGRNKTITELDLEKE